MPNVNSLSELNDEYHQNVGLHIICDVVVPTFIRERKFEELQISKDSTIYKLVDRIQLDVVSFIKGEFVKYKRTNYFEIKYSWSKNRRNGLMTYLFDFLLREKKFKILSDGEHTSPGSKEFWISLIERNQYDIFRFDIEVFYKRKAYLYNYNEIWGLTSEEKVLLERKKNRLVNFEELLLEELDDIRQSEIEEDEVDEMLTGFEIVEDTEESPQLKDERKFIKEYNELLKNKFKIRLIAQKKNT